MGTEPGVWGRGEWDGGELCEAFGELDQPVGERGATEGRRISTDHLIRKRNRHQGDKSYGPDALGVPQQWSGRGAFVGRGVALRFEGGVRRMVRWAIRGVVGLQQVCRCGGG